jgi:LysR family transcriptional activator of nhaA
MLNYNHLHYFHVAATEGSVAATAARLGVTQPTVSEQIRSLERALGMTLFERTAAGLRLTDAGRVAYEHTSVMFRAGERLIEALGHESRQVPRTLRVGISAGVARSHTADFLLPLFALEDCIPSIRSGDAVELMRDVRGADLDLLLTETPPPENALRGLELAELARSSLVAVGAPTVQPSASWENVGIIQYRTASAVRWAVESFLEERALIPQTVGEADDALLLVEAAARGGFVAVVPLSSARDAIASGRLRVLASIGGEATVFAIYQDGESANLARRAVAVLIEQIRFLADAEGSPRPE